MQDGFDLYLHGFILADDGQWVVVQQGAHRGGCQNRGDADYGEQRRKKRKTQHFRLHFERMNAAGKGRFPELAKEFSSRGGCCWEARGTLTEAAGCAPSSRRGLRMKPLFLFAAFSMCLSSLAHAAAALGEAKVPIPQEAAISLKVCATPVAVDPPIGHPLGSHSMPTREINQLRIGTPLAH